MQENKTDKVWAALEVAKSIAQEFEMVREYQQFKEALRELEGHVIVPVEPTEAQIDRVFPHSGNADFNDIRYEVRENYRAMIAACVKGE